MRDQSADDRFAARSYCHYRIPISQLYGGKWDDGYFVDHAIAQQANAFGFDLDHIAGLKIARRIEPAPAPVGVPVTMTSPGISVVKVEM